MNNWRIAGQIASGFGIVSVVFAAFAAFINYEINTFLYGSIAPSGFIQMSALEAMLPFLILAVLSFVVAGIATRSAREKSEKEAKPSMAESMVETQTEETQSQVIP